MCSPLQPPRRASGLRGKDFARATRTVWDILCQQRLERLGNQDKSTPSEQTQIPVNILAGDSLETASIAQRSLELQMIELHGLKIAPIVWWVSSALTCHCFMGKENELLSGCRRRSWRSQTITAYSPRNLLITVVVCWPHLQLPSSIPATSLNKPFGNLSGPLTVSSRGVHFRSLWGHKSYFIIEPHKIDKYWKQHWTKHIVPSFSLPAECIQLRPNTIQFTVHVWMMAHTATISTPYGMCIQQ